MWRTPPPSAAREPLLPLDHPEPQREPTPARLQFWEQLIRTCIETTETYCCFNSRLSRIINEQGRAQLGRGWGGAQGPDCSGFALTQLQALDFSRMDLTEFYAEIAPTLPNLGDLQQRAQQKVNSYFGP